MKETLMFILKTILGEDKNIELSEETESSGTINYNIEVSDDLKPRLIGKGGRTISAVYHLLNIQAKRENTRIHLKIKD
ncbi:KH domain-containing protein [Candidatus Dojkabacteria bacterium]|nr:KH domain-containing protein [Candidatus Dojkabacteria bacterium]